MSPLSHLRPAQAEPAWPALALRWALGDPSDDRGLGDGPPAACLVARLEPTTNHHGSLAAWVERPGQVTPPAVARPVRCHALRDGAFLHLDVYEGEHRRVALSLCGDEVRYCRSDLPGAFNLAGGTYEPVVVRPVATRAPAATG
jgi:hypothetical protein